MRHGTSLLSHGFESSVSCIRPYKVSKLSPSLRIAVTSMPNPENACKAHMYPAHASKISAPRNLTTKRLVITIPLPCQEISRRELRKGLERHGVSNLAEEEVLVLCDSIDPDRRGRVRISDVRDALSRGVVGMGIRCAGEVGRAT